MQSELIPLNNFELTRTEIAKKLVAEGPYPEARKSVLFWLDPDSVNQERTDRLNQVMREALTERDEAGDTYIYRGVFKEKSKKEDLDEDIYLLKTLINQNVPLPAVRGVAVRLIDKDLGWENNSIRDESTGLYNRGFMVRGMEEMLEHFLMGESDSAICFIDLDNLKKHNKPGYNFGNGAIQAVANALRSSGGIAGRIYRGDENMLIMPGISNDAEIAKAMQIIRDDGLPYGISDVKRQDHPEKQISGEPINFSDGFTTFREVINYLVNENPDFSELTYFEIRRKIIDTALLMSQSFQIINKGIKKEKPLEQIMKELNPQTTEANKKVIEFCLKKAGPK
ncbi:MAG: hypothetical protein UV73_C0001G0037 [Candidatus Gottesmanbacteria bacterium GW2011_GWA2_43_14]|uniref:GGDEF domain-containing protein n=1 Tax=Candidatus Gottesmanbacteria bacterium GW2011_GWA2_43_14 TaxID=1618443 RepID=A0A0G1FU33_9BACT|nr:MAG: hypothetical protein UV73_C0001G0037 [Candidatus Gottesmanbacteria bacterium GW2011_GWA2_43_14]